MLRIAAILLASLYVLEQSPKPGTNGPWTTFSGGTNTAPIQQYFRLHMIGGGYVNLGGILTSTNTDSTGVSNSTIRLSAAPMDSNSWAKLSAMTKTVAVILALTSTNFAQVVSSVTLTGAVAITNVNPVVASGDIIDSSRLANWVGNTGVRGGIVRSSTISASIAAGANQTTVQNAINAAASNSVVLLNTGVYTIANLTMPSYVELRGKTNTTMNLSGTIDIKCGGRMNGQPSGAWGAPFNLTRDAVKGGTTVVVTNIPSWIVDGQLAMVVQIDKAGISTNWGAQSSDQSFFERFGYPNRGMFQIDRVTSHTSTSVTFEIGMYYGWETGQVAQIFRSDYDPSTDNVKAGVGIEDMTIVGGSIVLDVADSCWIQNCVITNNSQGQTPMVQSYLSYRCEVNHCTMSDAVSLSGGEGYGAGPYFSSAMKVEDCIMTKLHGPGVISSSSGDAFLYNYVIQSQSDAGQNCLATHEMTCMANLFEGNYCDDKILKDDTHGGAYLDTIFANRITGINSNATYYPDSTVCLEIEYFNVYHNLVGNILGWQGVQNKLLTCYTNQTLGSRGSIYYLGVGATDSSGSWTNCATCPAENSYTNGMFILVSANWDAVTGGQIFEPLVTSHTLTNSYAYLSKPAFFGSLTWPPFNAANGAAYTNADARELIPAGYRYVHGVDP